MTKPYCTDDRDGDGDRHPPISVSEAEAGARAIVKLFDLWELDDVEACVLLGGIDIERWERWKQGRVGQISRECAMRLSLLLGIHIGLKVLFKDSAMRRGWIRKPHPDLGGEAPLSVMKSHSINGLERVRNYLLALGQ